MSAMTGKELGEKLLRSVKQMKRDQPARTTTVMLSEATRTRTRTRTSLSQTEFAPLLGVAAAHLKVLLDLHA